MSWYGYNPNLSVSGKNPNYPSVLLDTTHPLEGQTTSKLIVNYLNAMPTVHSAFSISEASWELG